jgi:hypothetical protein
MKSSGQGTKGKTTRASHQGQLEAAGLKVGILAPSVRWRTGETAGESDHAHPIDFHSLLRLMADAGVE